MPDDCRETIFEGVKFGDNSSIVDAHFDRISLNARQQMRTTQSGAQHAKWKAFKDRYGNQCNEIIEGFKEYDRSTQGTHGLQHGKSTRSGKRQSKTGACDTVDETDTSPPTIVREGPGMFTGKAGIASNWKTGFTTVINGTGYQHPHTDAGRAETYKGLKIFPFVTLHGFGIDEFSMWLLPDPLSKNNKYGFLHTFKASQMLFMRGDFLHGGVPSTLPRGHMKFFPSAEAGWKRQSSYWNRKEWETTTFMWQGTFPPFGYPCAGSPDLAGVHVVTYPVEFTKLLRYPYTEKECELLGIAFEPLSDEDISERKALKKKAVGQLAYGIF